MKNLLRVKLFIHPPYIIYKMLHDAKSLTVEREKKEVLIFTSLDYCDCC